MLTHLDLCAGIGGFSLASGWAEYTTIGFCEIDPFCQRVLKKHWPFTPIHDDLRTLRGADVRQWLADTKQGIRNDGRVTANAESVQRTAIKRGEPDGVADVSGTVGLVTAGYPCQPFSQAGKRLGEEDDRHLWPAIAALVAELQPAQCLFENVAGHITLGLDRVLADLEEIGYACGTVVVPACAVNAPHRRDRVWIMAHAGSTGRQQVTRSAHGDEAAHEGRSSEHDHVSASDGQSDGTRTLAHAADGRIRRGSASGQAGFTALGGEVATDITSTRLERPFREIPEGGGIGPPDGDWWRVEPAIRRVAHGVPSRVDRLRSLGNSIVPAVAFEIIQAMKESHDAVAYSN